MPIAATRPRGSNSPQMAAGRKGCLGIRGASRYASSVVKVGESSQAPVVLVVEDDQVNQMLLAEVCRSEGYGVVTASDGEAAIEVFGDRAIDIVLVDAAMPKMDGFTVCRLIRGLSDVPVIMVTASLEDGVRERALSAGATAFVSKPFRIFELARHMRAALFAGGSPSEPPSTRPSRRVFAHVLDHLEGPMQLRAGLRRAFDEGGGKVCLLLRLENETDVVERVGRSTRDALLGFAGHGLERGIAGDKRLYWAESNELAVVLEAEHLDDLIGVLGDVLEEVRGFGIEGVQFRYGAVRFRAGERLDVDQVLRATREAVVEAGRRGEKGRVEELTAQRQSASPA